MPPNVRDHGRSLGALWVVLAACAAFAGSVHGAFLWDDINLVLQNTRTHGLSHLPELLGMGDAHFGFRMVRDLSYAVDYEIGGLAPLVYHLSNILYHAITSWLVYRLALRITTSGTVAFWAGMLFAVHPVHVDAVAYVSGRRDILSALFYLAGLLAFIRFRESGRWAWFAVAALTGVVGVLAKEMAATLPIAWFLYDTWLAAGGGGFVAGARRALARHWPLYGGGGVLAAAFVAYVVLAQGVTHGAGPYGASWPIHVMSEVMILAYALKVLLLPVTLLVDYQGYLPPVSGPADPRFVAGAALLLALIGLSAWAFRGRRDGAFCMHWLWITYLPVMQIVPHPERFAEHYLYLPSVGAALLGGMLIARLAAARSGRWAVGVAAALCLVLFARTLDRVHDYRGPIPVLEKARAVNPDGMRILNNLALAYGESGDRERAIRMLTEAVNRVPGPLLTTNLARYLRDAGRLEEAEYWLLDAYARTPADADVLDLLGDTFLKLGKPADAERAWRELLAVQPGSTAAWMGLGNLARAQGRLAEAAAAYQRVTRADPGRVGAWNGLGIALQGQGDVPGARAAFERGLALDPADGDAWNNLGVLRLRMGEPDGALEAFRRALEAPEVPPMAHLNLARLLVLGGRCGEAVAVLNRAGDALNRVPPQALAQLAGAFGRACGPPPADGTLRSGG